MDEALIRLIREKAIDALYKTVSKIIDTELVTIEDNSIFVNLPRKSDNTYFLLRIDLPDTFNLDPADYYFVNPENKTDRNSQFWPNDGDDSFKINNQNPPWICIAGTSAYKHHHQKYDPKIHTLSQTVIHIYRQINGWKKNA